MVWKQRPACVSYLGCKSLAKELPHCLYSPPSLTIPEGCLNVEAVAAILFTQNAAFIAPLLQSGNFSNAAGSRLITSLKPAVRNRVYCLVHPEDYGLKVRDTNKGEEEDEEEEKEGEDNGEEDKGEKPWERGQIRLRTQVIGLSLNALGNSINLFKEWKENNYYSNTVVMVRSLLWKVESLETFTCYPGTVLAYLL